MPDTSMCASTTCPQRATCYRNAASGTEPHPYRQSYGMFDEGPACADYWPVKQPISEEWCMRMAKREEAP